MFVAISGPEKAGKTTLIAALEEALKTPSLMPYVRHWSGPATDQRNTRFLQPLRQDYAAAAVGQPIIWDRSWLCHNVYGLLLQSPMNETVRNPLLSEWLYGRAVDHLGAKFVLLPQDWRESQARRDESDLPVHARFEVEAYRNLAHTYGWTILENQYTKTSVLKNVVLILQAIQGDRPHRLEELVTPPNARVCFVGERPEECDATQGEWLPFSNREGIAFANMLGPKALGAGWAYSHRMPPQVLRRFDTLVTFGELPYLWCKSYVGHKKVIALPALRHVVSRKYDSEWPRTLDLLRNLMAPDVLRLEEAVTAG